MSVTATLFDRWKAAKKHSSDRAALAALGVSHGAAVHWKAGRNADADVIERMANDLGENAGALIAQAMAESAKGEAARTWARLAKRLAAAAVVVLSVAVPYRAEATNQGISEQKTACALCEVARRMLRRALTALRQYWMNEPSPVLA